MITVPSLHDVRKMVKSEVESREYKMQRLIDNLFKRIQKLEEEIKTRR